MNGQGVHPAGSGVPVSVAAGVNGGGTGTGGEPAHFRLLAGLVGGTHQVDVAARLDRGRLDLEVDHLGDPVVIDRGAPAVARQQRGGHAGDAGQEDLVDGLFQHVQAGHADDGVHVAADNDL